MTILRAETLAFVAPAIVSAVYCSGTLSYYVERRGEVFAVRCYDHDIRRPWTHDLARESTFGAALCEVRRLVYQEDALRTEGAETNAEEGLAPGA